MWRIRPSLRGRLALVVAAATVPMALVAAVLESVDPPPAATAAVAAAGMLLSALVGWGAARALIGAPLMRLGAMLGGGGSGDPLVDLSRGIGQMTAELGRCRDETKVAAKARIAAEEELHNSMEVLSSMVTTLPVGVVAIGRDGLVKLWNHAAETILGYSATDMVGRPPPAGIFAASPDGAGAADVFLRMVTGQRVKGEEVHCWRKDGSVVQASFSGAPLMDDNERLRGAICVFEDISQRKTIAGQLHQAQKMEAVGQLTGGLAHDFNNILGVAIGNLDLLGAELADRPQAVELADTALNALLRGAELTRALLAFSRRQPLKPALLNVADLLTQAARMLSRTLGEHIHVVLKAEGDLWPVLADAAQLEAAITNLAINARDAMPNGGRLAVSARNADLDQAYVSQVADIEPGRYVMIEISDTGNGMSPEVLARVFEPFYTTKAVGQGTGLGLSMVYGFIKQSGGHIKIYSEVGHGTTVRLYLPRTAAAVPSADAAGTIEPIPGGNETVLVVEDNADVRKVVESQLSRLGYRVVVAAHGPAALAVLESGLPVDLLFTDVVMPEGMTGFELADAARASRPGLKVLVTSGFPGASFHPPAGLDAGMNFLSKPYRRQDLAHAVRDVLDGKGTQK